MSDQPNSNTPNEPLRPQRPAANGGGKENKSPENGVTGDGPKPSTRPTVSGDASGAVPSKPTAPPKAAGTPNTNPTAGAVTGAANGMRNVSAADGGVAKTSAALNASDGAPIGSGIPTAGGIAADAVEGGRAATQGDVVGVAEAGTRTVATGVATYFGGTIAGDFTRRILNSAVGRKTTRLTVWIVFGVVAALVIPFVFGAAAVVGVVSGFGNLAAAAATSCFAGPGATRGPLGSQENPSPEEVAGQIYAQVRGYGYGDYAAGIALASAYFETTMRNLARGDQWRSGAGMTGSRGIYQQFPGAVPPDMAWSGKPDPGNYDPRNQADYSVYGETNAWGPNGWALSDPRMNVAQASNIFVLGMGAGTPTSDPGYWGLDSPLMPNRDKLTSNSTPTAQEVWSGMYYVQGFNPASGENQSWAQQSYNDGIKFLKEIQEGKIAVPPFVPPMEFMKNRADSPQTKAVVGRGTSTGAEPSAPAANEPGGSNQDGRNSAAAATQTTIMGDSHVVGMMSTVGPEQTGADRRYSYTQVNGKAGLQMGPYYVYGLEGISLSQVVNANGVVPGSTGNTDVNKWREAISNGPSRIVVDLGTNDGAGAALAGNVDKFMTLAGPNRPVLWVMPYFTKNPEAKAALEKALREAAEKHANLTLVETANLNLNVADGLHTDAAGNLAIWNAIQAALSGSKTGLAFSANCGTLGFVPAAGELQQRALQWAKGIVDNPRARYPYSIEEAAATSATNLDGLVWDCSNLTTGAYYYASGGTIRIPDLSGSQLYDTVGTIQVVPWEEAQPGDIFFQYTGGAGGSDSSLGHVGMLWEKNLESPNLSKIIHACSQNDVCGEGAATGIGIQDIGSTRNMYVPNDPAKANNSRPRGGNTWSTDPTKAWYGRVVGEAVTEGSSKPGETPGKAEAEARRSR